LDELGLCETGVIVEEVFPVLVAAIVEHARKSELLSSVDEFSFLKLLMSPWVGVDGVAGGLESQGCVLLSFDEFSHP
jgi:hypothetical protein